MLSLTVSPTDGHFSIHPVKRYWLPCDSSYETKCLIPGIVVHLDSLTETRKLSETGDCLKTLLWLSKY